MRVVVAVPVAGMSADLTQHSARVSSLRQFGPAHLLVFLPVDPKASSTPGVTSQKDPPDTNVAPVQFKGLVSLQLYSRGL